MIELSSYQKFKIKISLRIITFGAFLGAFFVFANKGFIENYHHYYNGIVSGIVIGLFISIVEVYVFARNARKIKFFWFLLIRLGVYTISLVFILVHVAVISQMIRMEESYSEVWSSKTIQFYINEGSFQAEVIYIIVFAVLINFTRIMSIKLGQGVLQNYLKGTYFTPKKEDRIFMFLKIENAEKQIHRLGPLKFHKFLNKFYYDLSESIIANNSVIYEYVEDLMVLTWSYKRGVRNSNCLQLFFELEKTIARHNGYYQRHFGFEPKIKASIHCGSVVGAEIGELKTQIVYQGDTLNTTSRILDKCFELDEKLLISEALENILTIPKKMNANRLSGITLKGKSTKKTLFSISKQIKTSTKHANAI
jgi:adenylate cyclase